MVENIKEFSIAGLIPAGGVGERLGLGPKAFLKIGGKSLLKIVVSNISKFVDRVLVGVPSDFVEKAKKEAEEKAEIYPGGKSRQETIKILFQKTKEDIILVHDVVRPFASEELIKKVIEGAKKFGVCGVFIPSHLPVFLFQDNFVISSLPSKGILHPQSPQAFRREILERAFRFADENFLVEQTLYELILKIGGKIYWIRGEDTNIKITTPFDFEIAKKVFSPIFKNKRRRNGN